MRQITLTADPADVLAGHLPESLAEVPLTAYAALAGATTLPARVEATAALLGLPAAPLLEDVSLYMELTEAAPWLFGGSLPPTGEPVPVFTHAGTRYRHVGNLRKINAGQLEALVGFLAANPDGNALSVAPRLLAVLYCPEGQAQTAEVVAATAAAFEMLPMSVAWPALADFMRISGPLAVTIRTASALSAQLRNLTRQLEASLVTPTASTTLSSRLLRWLTRQWLRNVSRTLTTRSK